MALITCHKCGKPVSDRAEKCPHCGCNPKDCGGVEKLNDAAPKEVSNSTPTIKTEKSSNNTVKIIVIALLVVIVLAVLGIFGYQKYRGQNPNEEYADSDVSVATAVDTVEAVDDTQAKLDEFKNFSSNDLSAFRLHGKVKMVEEVGYDVTMYFDENGTLTRYVDRWGETEITHEDDVLSILSQGSASFTITVRDGRIAESKSGPHQGVIETAFYSDYDANNCPTKYILQSSYCGDDETDEELEASEYVIKYSDYDEYGNFQKMAYSDGNETWVTTRKITYYPIGN